MHVAPGARGAVNEQVLTGVAGKLYRPPMLRKNESPVICRFAVPVLVMVTTLVTAARDVGIENVNVGTPPTVVIVPLVAEVKLSVPCARTPVPVSVTGEPVTATPV